MRSFRCTFVALCLSAGMIDAADQPRFSPAQQEVINAHEARTQASNKRDQVAYSCYVADDCIFSGDNGSVLDQSSADGECRKVAHGIRLLDQPSRLRRPPVRRYCGADASLYEPRAVHRLRYRQRNTDDGNLYQAKWQLALIARQWAKIPTISESRSLSTPASTKIMSANGVASPG